MAVILKRLLHHFKNCEVGNLATILCTSVNLVVCVFPIFVITKCQRLKVFKTFDASDLYVYISLSLLC